MSKTSVCIQAGTILLIILRKRAVSAFYAGWVSAKHPSAFPSQKLMQYFIIAYRSIKSMMSPYKAPFLVQSCRWNFCGSHFGAQGILFPRSPQELTKGARPFTWYWRLLHFSHGFSIQPECAGRDGESWPGTPFPPLLKSVLCARTS